MSTPVSVEVEGKRSTPASLQNLGSEGLRSHGRPVSKWFCRRLLPPVAPILVVRKTRKTDRTCLRRCPGEKRRMPGEEPLRRPLFNCTPPVSVCCEYTVARAQSAAIRARSFTGSAEQMVVYLQVYIRSSKKVVGGDPADTQASSPND